eukprot:2041031-Ditylum_brightwellii.AAC.1
MIGHYHCKNEGNYRLMQCAPRARQHPIQHEEVTDELMGNYKNEQEGDNGSMWHALRASHPLIQHDDLIWCACRAY